MQAVLTDIEGTTSSLSFVKDVLFPYARQMLPAYVRGHRGEAPVVAALDAVRRHEQRSSLHEDEIIELLLRWMDEDRKATPLKALQGFVWREGYRSGAFQGHVYDDAVLFLRRWHARGLGLYIFSSGSIDAQRLLFQHSTHGDLAAIFSGFFDTTTGGKRDSSSYSTIAQAIRAAPQAILFLSDTIEELDAARAAGMRTTWLHRDGSSAAATHHPEAMMFDGVDSLLSGPVTGDAPGGIECAPSSNANRSG